MPPLKHIERSATVGFCPTAGLLAAGTVAGAIDMSFSTSSVLEVFAMDFASATEALPLAGSVGVPERFHRLIWGNSPSDTTSLPYGIIVGGLADGSVCLWDPAAILEKSSDRNPLLAKMQKHTGAVKGLDFNPLTPNLLATGAADGELCIWDVAHPAQPSLYPSLKGAPGGTSSDITHISWNRKVAHILASTNSDGSCVVWDLKRQRPISNLKDTNSHRRCSVVQWSPDVATQLIVASDDDRSPTLQMWDLRNSMSPIAEFVGHSKGVLGMSWCQQDPSLLLSSAKDNRTVVWDVGTTDVMTELPTGTNWNFDVQWCPTTPGVFSAASFDGKVEVYNLLSCTGADVVETINPDFSVSRTSTGSAKPLKRAPAWLRRPAGCCFGFGGKLVTFHNAKHQVTDPTSGQAKVMETGTLSITQVVTEQGLVARSEEFEHIISSADRTALRTFCATKQQEAAAAAPEEAETWSFLSVLFEDDARRQLLGKLGFAEAMAAAGGPSRTASTALGGAEQQLAAAVEHLKVDGKPTIEVPNQQPEDYFAGPEDPGGFFDNLGESAAATAITGSSPTHATANGGAPSEPGTPLAGVDSANHAAVSESTEREEEIQRALFVGNYAAAVDACLRAGRMADALLIANIGGADLFKRTMHRYMRRNPRPYMQIMNAMVDSDYAALVTRRPVAQWRETLAVLATYTGAEQWAGLCDALASRLAHAGMHHAASLCYVCAGNVDQAVAYWAKAVSAAAATNGSVSAAADAGAAEVAAMQAVIEKSIVMGLATNSKAASGALSDLVTRYAGLLVAQGRMATALQYLQLVPGEAASSVAVLKDRIYRSGAPGIPNTISPPPFPFVEEKVTVAPQPTTPQATTAPAAQPYGATTQAYGQTAGSAYGQTANAGYGQTAAGAGYGQAASTGYGQAAATGYGAASGAGYGATAHNAVGSVPGLASSPRVGPGGAVPAPVAANTYTSSYGQVQQSGWGQQQGGSSGGYGQSAAAAPAPLAPSAYGSGSGSYGQQAQQPWGQQQQQPAAGGYGQSGSGSYYGAQQPGGFGSSGGSYSAPVQEPVAVYQPKRASAAAAVAPVPAAAPPTTFMPSQTAAPPMQGAAPPPSGQFKPGVPQHQQQQQAPQGMFQPQQAQQQQQPQQVNVPTPQFFQPTAPSSVRPGGPAPFGAAASAYGAGAGMPGMGGVSSPMAAAAPPAAPAQPAGPPPHITMATADTSKLSADQKPVVASLNALFNACMPLATNPARKREMDDNSKRLGGLLWRLNEGQITPRVVERLLALCRALDAGDWAGASAVQVELTASDWDECGHWLTALKRLIKVRQMAG